MCCRKHHTSSRSSLLPAPGISPSATYLESYVASRRPLALITAFEAKFSIPNPTLWTQTTVRMARKYVLIFAIFLKAPQKGGPDYSGGLYTIWHFPYSILCLSPATPTCRAGLGLSPNRISHLSCKLKLSKFIGRRTAKLGNRRNRRAFIERNRSRVLEPFSYRNSCRPHRTPPPGLFRWSDD